jgi:hypothetical protein
MEPRTSNLTILACLVLKEVDFGPSGMACSGGSQFWPHWHGFDWRKLILACLKWLGSTEIVFGLYRLDRPRLGLEKVDSGLPKMADQQKLFLACTDWINQEDDFRLPRLKLPSRSRFLPDWTGLDWPCYRP